MSNSLPAILQEIMADAERAAQVIETLTHIGVLAEFQSPLAKGYPYGYYTSEQRRGQWMRVYHPVAAIDYDHTSRPPRPTAVRFAPQVHAPAALLARLIEVHRERLQRVAALRPEADELAKVQRGAVR